jgi:signal transduction histidine kinase
VRETLGESHPALDELDSVTTIARQTAERLRDDVWIIKPGSDSLDNLALRMKDVTQSVIGHINHSFSADKDGDGRPIPLSFRRNVLLIYKEALHNILKHSKATRVAISIRFVDSSLTLDVRDNGTGFDEQEAPKGNGLVNMRRRAEALNGEIVIDSVKCQGTHIQFRVKIPRTRY